MEDPSQPLQAGVADGAAATERLRRRRRRNHVGANADGLAYWKEILEYELPVDTAYLEQACMEALTACERTARWAEALEVLRQAADRGVAPSLQAHKAAIQACAAGGQPGAALAVLEDVIRNTLEPDAATYEGVVRAGLGATGTASASGAGANTRSAAVALMMANHRKALDRGEVPDLVGYRSMLRICALAMQWEQALALIAEMTERGVGPEEEDYILAVESCREAGRWREALQLLVGLRQRGVQLGVAAYRAVACLCLQAERRAEALQLLRETRQLAIAPDPILYEAAISAAARTKVEFWQPQLLKESVQALLQDRGGEDGSAYGAADFAAAIRSCGRLKQWALAVHLLAQLQSRGLDPDAAVLNGVGAACARSGVFGPVVLQTLQELRGRRLKPDDLMYHSAILAHVLEGDWMLAQKLYAETWREHGTYRWISSASSINVTALDPDVAAVATQIFVEDSKRKPNTPRRSLVIFTGGGPEGVGGVPDADGFDSDIKRHVHRVLTQDLGVKVDHLTRGEITVSKLELRRLRSSMAPANATSARPKRRRAKGSARQRALDLAWRPQEEGG